MNLEQYTKTLDTLKTIYSDLLRHCQTPADFAELKAAIHEHLDQLESEIAHVTRP